MYLGTLYNNLSFVKKGVSEYVLELYLITSAI